MKTEIVSMTPEWAMQLLHKNTSNRSLHDNRVQQYKQQILNGEWRLNHQGIAVGTDGVLIDGQHRLAAIAQAGIPVEVLLSTECDPSVFATIDTGRKRTVGDALGILGVRYRTAAASCCRLSILYLTRPDYIWRGPGASISHTRILSWYDQHENEVNRAVEFAYKCYTDFPKIPMSVYACFAYLAWAENRDPRQFLIELSAGENLRVGTPVYAFRKTLINGISELSKEANKAQATLASVIFVYNKWYCNLPLKHFKCPTFAPMPKIASL